jgi:FKBP-type peptidyl-prolyl cis-trans isomerase
MARKRDRAFALFGALLFLLTSSALTIAVIYSVVQQNQQNKAAAKASAQSASTVKQTNKVTGTKMQDFTPTSTPQTQLKIEDTKIGTGTTVQAGDTVTADYVGALMSTGVIFDASADHGGPVSFPLGQVIAGWSQGIPGMKVGGTRRLLIPAGLAYGANPPQGSNIPVNADLVFDVTITKVGK